MSAFQNCGTILRFGGDASVFGLGAYLTVNGKVVSWYASDISREDEKFLDIRKGDEKCQQVAESLNLLVALRTWKEFWCQERVSLEVRSDNIAALTLVMNLKGSSRALNQVARELALDLGDAAFKPGFVTHTPGVASSKADVLSRKFSPSSEFLLPSALKDVPEVFPEPRVSS